MERLPLNTAVDLLIKLQPLLGELVKLKHQLRQQGIRMEVKINLTYGALHIKFKQE